MPQAAALSHRLNAPCPRCEHPQWLHTNRCLNIGCECRHTARKFTR